MIVLSEWRDLDLNKRGDKFPKYAAISHSWTPSTEVQRLSSIANRPLEIHVAQESPHQISWHGLCQAARAAHYLKCDFLWLDLICLNQTSPTDKKLQIQKMGNIYENAAAVVVMPGGVAAAQDAEYPAPWITRAWTLQEATLCANTHMFILHPDIPIHSFASSGPNYNIIHIEGDLALSPIRDLLSSRGGVILNSETFAAQCFGHDFALTSSLEGVLHGHTPAMRRSAAWRSIWLRTSKYPQDMVFSVMHLLGVHIEVDYTRERDDLLMELARKASVPSWLDIGPDLPFDRRYGLFPAIPPFNAHQTPAYIVGDQFVPVARYVRNEYCISNFDIKIWIPDDAPHDGNLVCAEIFEIHPDSSGTPSISNSLGDTHKFKHEEVTGSHVMVIWTIEKFGLHGEFGWIGPAACHLRKSKSGIWERVGCGTYVPDSFKGTIERSRLRIGGFSRGKITSCDCDEKERKSGSQPGVPEWRWAETTFLSGVTLAGHPTYRQAYICCGTSHLPAPTDS
ncbi:hypothetical protein F5B18DRAFT_113950 [Nemania serpens]|nr:hypothetical protein F5B18DRAFT_113950 [Nemania serpens]